AVFDVGAVVDDDVAAFTQAFAVYQMDGRQGTAGTTASPDGRLASQEGTGAAAGPAVEGASKESLHHVLGAEDHLFDHVASTSTENAAVDHFVSSEPRPDEPIERRRHPRRHDVARGDPRCRVARADVHLVVCQDETALALEAVEQDREQRLVVAMVGAVGTRRSDPLRS